MRSFVRQISTFPTAAAALQEVGDAFSAHVYSIKKLALDVEITFWPADYSMPTYLYMGRGPGPISET